MHVCKNIYMDTFLQIVFVILLDIAKLPSTWAHIMKNAFASLLARSYVIKLFHFCESVRWKMISQYSSSVYFPYVKLVEHLFLCLGAICVCVCVCFSLRTANHMRYFICLFFKHTFQIFLN